ncbi:hypothetical protein KY289_000302 [Solanum tuberosum]|nr:hypothetical protein KY289_000302 [Solanum tuberosum]
MQFKQQTEELWRTLKVAPFLFASYSQIEYFSITYWSYYQEKSVFAKCVRHCRSRDPEDSCGASDACSNYKSSKFTG